MLYDLNCGNHVRHLVSFIDPSKCVLLEIPHCWLQFLSETYWLLWQQLDYGMEKDGYVPQREVSLCRTLNSHLVATKRLYMETLFYLLVWKAITRLSENCVFKDQRYVDFFSLLIILRWMLVTFNLMIRVFL